MKNVLKKIWFVIISIRFIPHIIVLKAHPQKEILKADLDKWIQVLRIKRQGVRGFLFLLAFIKEYRTVFYFRVGPVSRLLNILAWKPNSTFIYMNSGDIGTGLVLQHGFSCVINAISIGQNCQIWHNVTIGLSESGTNKKPIIKDNVKICAGAIVIGKITIGNNVVIGAGAVVTKNVPDDCIVAGNPAVIINRNGNKVHEQL